MNSVSDKTIVASMNTRKMREWTPEKHRKSRIRPGKTWISIAAVVLCLTIGTLLIAGEATPSESVMSHLKTGFEYDEAIGRLQYVSSVLPESAMVFLNSTNEEMVFAQPTDTQIVHAWSQSEPWIEYACTGSIHACQSGEVMTVVRNRSDEYTVRVLHEGGYESIYSGLTGISLKEGDVVSAGAQIGSASGYTAFELRKDGLSILPMFSGI